MDNDDDDRLDNEITAKIDNINWLLLGKMNESLQSAEIEKFDHWLERYERFNQNCK